MNNNLVIYLSVQTWRGLSLGAQHWYGELRGDDGKIDITQIMNDELAKHLSIAHDFNYKVGNTTACFRTKESLIDAGKKLFLEKFPHALLLLEGNPAYAEPHYALSGRADLVDKANKLHYKLALLDKKPYMEKEYLALCNEWDAFIETFSPGQ